MWTGRQTLASIEQTIAKLHQDEVRIDDAMKSALADAERLRQDRQQALAALARIKLDEMTAGRLVRDLDVTERRALQLIEGHRNRMVSLTERRQRAVTELEESEAARHAAGSAVEVALAEVEKRRATVAEQLKTDADWIRLDQAFAAVDAVAVEAEKKAAQSEAELGAKQKPYDQDPLFIYLWRRNFGTSKYDAGNVARILDRMVADFIGYPGARANYAMLLEIPLRLREHAKARRAAADEAKADRGDLERRALVAHGIEPLERALATARHKLAATEATVESRTASLKAIDAERDALLKGGEDAAYGEAIATIASGDAQDELSVLYREARRTSTTADEDAVRRIGSIDDALRRAEMEIRDLRHRAHDLAGRRTEVESVRERFRRSGYDHPHVIFGNDHDIGRILAGVLEGVVRSGILWDIIRGGFGTRPPQGRPGLGEPSFPFPFPVPGGGDDGPQGGGWRVPESRGGWSRRDDDGDDDFKTGGSF